MSNIKSEVLTTVTLPLSEMLKKIKSDIDDIKYVYDEGLDYNSGLRKFRDDNNMNQESQPPFPLFIFKRSVLRYAETYGGIGRRSTTHKVIYQLGDDLSPHVSATILQGEFDVEFMYVAKDIQDIERFEVSYLGLRGFANGQKLSVNIPELNELLEYHLDFKEGLDDKTINVDDNYYKALRGKFLIRGFFLIFKGQVSLIKSVNATISSFNEDVLLNMNIEA